MGTASNSHALQRSRKDAPLGKPAVEGYLKFIDVETRDFVRQCFNAGSQPIDPLRLLQRMSLSLDLTLCWGRRVALDDPLLHEIVDVEHQIVEMRNTMTNYQDCLPFLRLPFSSTTRKAVELRQRRDTYYNSLNTGLEDRLHNDPTIPCIRADLMRANVSEEELNLICLTFISAGMAPTVATLQWSLAYLARRPDIQAEAFHALQQHHGSSSAPLGDINDDQGCAYIVALAKECLRYFTVARCALPRSTVKEFNYAGNTIPAGTTVFLNAWACNMGTCSTYLPLTSSLPNFHPTI
jgi:3-hydroxyphenylacetate 6-hydroxylase